MHKSALSFFLGLRIEGVHTLTVVSRRERKKQKEHQGKRETNLAVS